MATLGFLSSLELRVQFCLLVCCTCPSSSTVNKEKNLIDQRASLRVDTRERQQASFTCPRLGVILIIKASITLLTSSSHQRRSRRLDPF